MRTEVMTAAVVLAVTSITSADLIIDDGIMLDISVTIGSGDFTSYTVIDFAATGGASYALAYQWSGDGTTHDMLQALDDAGLTYDWTDWGTGIFTDNFSWNGETGDPGLFWAHSLTSPAGDGVVEWTDAWSAVDATALSDGLISGWYNGFNDDYSAITPTLPLATIPGPVTIAVLMLAGVGGRRRTALSPECVRMGNANQSSRPASSSRRSRSFSACRRSRSFSARRRCDSALL